jgi:hypothetical protein
VVGVAVDLDDQPSAAPHEVDLDAFDEDVALGSWDPVVVAEL